MLIGLVLFFLAATASSGPLKSKLSWKHLTRDNFTMEHNWEIVKAHVKSADHLLALMKKPVPKGITLEHTIFTLYTRNGPADGVRVVTGDAPSLIAGGFQKSKPIVFATHGFLSGGTVDWMLQMKSAQLHAEDCNFITIDWSPCADNILYPEAVDCTKIVGGYLADLVAFLGAQGGNIKGIHAMGHSLGAHLVSQISQQHKIARITGWDPAGPLFDDDDLPGRLDPSDADVVDIIHTNCFMFGYDGLLGDYDFFPNGGDDQPGCFLLDYLCDHSMSYFYYIQSLYDNHKYLAAKCTTMNAAKDGDCSGSTNYMGVLSPNGAPGIYYLNVDIPATGNPLYLPKYS